jgi:CubicO group peptidase (beta-lactamase class C family)
MGGMSPHRSLGRFSTIIRAGRVGLGIVTVVLVAATVWFRPDRAMLVATGTVAKTLCSGVFVSGLDPDQVYAETLLPTPGLKRLSRLMQYTVDTKRSEVRADWADYFKSRAVYRGDAGCMLWRLRSPVPPAPALAAFASRAELLDIASSAAIVPGDSALSQALDRAFAEPTTGPRRRVKAVVVVKDGQVIAERYAPGVGVDTPLPGYSASKTAINALVGILVSQGKLRIDAPAPVAAWAGPGDRRHVITLDNLLRMTSGLAAEESDSGFDPTSRMMFVEPDMAAFAERAKLKRQPGTAWEYASPNTLIVSRIVKDAVGGREADVLNFARRELFAPLGMRMAVFETDAVGTPVGSTNMLASARDWARLGLLYLNDGVVGGRRLLPEGWVDYSRRSTLGSTYGAGVWTNDGPSDGARGRIRDGMPADGFFASGRLGQRIYVMPSRRLVVVRMGVTQQPPDFDIIGDLRLIRDMIAATTGLHPEVR